MSSSSTGTSSRTSEQPAARGTGNSDCGFTGGAVPQPPDRSAAPAADFKRWSRNLSSRRHKELHRLNEIEKRRQLLELRRQNDLFDQMSVTSGRQPVAESAAATSSDDSVAVSSGQTAPGDKGLASGPEGLSHGQQPPPDANDPTTGANSSSRHRSRRRRRWPHSNSAPDHSPTCAAAATRLQLKSASQRADSSCQPGDDESVGSFSDDRDELDETDEDEDADELQRDASVGIAGGELAARESYAPDAVAGQAKQVASADYKASCKEQQQQPLQLQLQLQGDKALIRQRLAGLVSTPVPKNKRFLCWIVREKVSKLSKARPYFYPTYYLYIQSIVAVHKAGGHSTGASLADRDKAPREQVVGGGGADSGMLAASDNGLDSGPGQPTAASSADNSMSASSSISADMLFMEAVGRASTGTRASSRPPGNSYSDNEVYSEQPATDDHLVSDGQLPEPAWSASQQADLTECFFDELRNPYSGSNAILLAARRRKKTKTYLIGPNECGYARKNCICKLKSNVLGTSFNASLCSTTPDAELDDQYSIASIGYETNVLGFRGPRKMRVFLPKQSCNHRTKELPELFKKRPSDVIHLKNMTPCWNIESQSYVLNFNGRVTQASVKNFQLIECDQEQASNNGFNRASASTPSLTRSDSLSVNDNNCQRDPSSDSGPTNTALSGYNNSIVMQFGRISNHEFTCDITHPMSILQGFAIALSSLDSKLACE